MKREKSNRLSSKDRSPYPYRIFVSYSSGDKDTAAKVVDHLKQMRLDALWDANLKPGSGFTEQIKERIECAHAFMPILTPAAKRKTWVHQEIGYALGLNVPVLPLAVGVLPQGIIERLEAVIVTPSLRDLTRRLTWRSVEEVVLQAQDESIASFRCALLPEERTEMLADLAHRALRLERPGRIRQRGAFSSFCIPDKPLGHPIWASREGRVTRSWFYRRLQREERRALEQHARQRGCDLILNPYIKLKRNGPEARQARLRTLVDFLKAMNETQSDVRIVIDHKHKGDNLLIVGDWFVAESMVPRPGVGYLQTICTRHAPTVLARLRQFDDEFSELQSRQDTGGRPSLAWAIEQVEKAI